MAGENACRGRDIFLMKTENEIAKMVLDAAFKVHTNLGPGLLESVYEAVLAYELTKCGVMAQRQVPIPIRYEELSFEEGFRADVLAGGSVIVELKSVEKLAPVHGRQVLTQLRLSGHRLGLLINFGETHLKDGIKRIANGMPD
jgi:GxxExxY protein